MVYYILFMVVFRVYNNTQKFTRCGFSIWAIWGILNKKIKKSNKQFNDRFVEEAKEGLKSGKKLSLTNNYSSLTDK